MLGITCAALVMTLRRADAQEAMWTTGMNDQVDTDVIFKFRVA